MSTEKSYRIAGYVVMAAILYFVFFLRLSSFHIRTWDESIYAIEAYEMLQDGNYLVPHNNGQIDYMHAKPLLAVWLQAISIKLLGFNELSVRLPSAIAGALCCLLLFYFIQKYINEFTAWCAFLVLVTAKGFVYFHTSRTGDTDATLTLLLFLSNIQFLLFLMNGKGKNVFFYFLFLSLAFLTKSLAALLFLPAHFILLLTEQKFITLFRKKEFYLGGAVFVTLSLGYIFARNYLDPIYIDTLLSTDFNRAGGVVDNHREPVNFYLDNFISGRFSFWLFPFITAMVYVIYNWLASPLILRWAVVLPLTFFVIISLSSTKLEWYDMPLYPYISLLAGYIMYQLGEKITLPKKVFALSIFFLPLYSSVKQSFSNSMNGWDYSAERSSDYLYEKYNNHVDPNTLAIADTSFNGPFLFYKYKFKERNQILRIVSPLQIKIGDKVLVTDHKIKNFIRSKFVAPVIDSADEVIVYHIIDVLK